MPRQHGGWTFSSCVSPLSFRPLSEGNMSALGLPRSLENLLTTLMSDHHLSSWKVASEGGKAVIVLRLNQTACEDGNSNTQPLHTNGSWRKKSPSQTQRDRQRAADRRQQQQNQRQHTKNVQQQEQSTQQKRKEEDEIETSTVSVTAPSTPTRQHEYSGLKGSGSYDLSCILTRAALTNLK